MNINSSQNIQSNNPPGSISTRRVNAVGASTASASSEDERAVEAQQQDSAVIRQLRARDREVRSHEAAHAAAGGSLVRGGPSFTLQQGPDGRSYAIGGEVQLDVSPVSGDPQATVTKSQRVRAAALAPAQPSAQDFKVAGNASQMAARARVEIAVQRREQAQPAEDEAVEETQPTQQPTQQEAGQPVVDEGAQSASNQSASDQPANNGATPANPVIISPPSDTGAINPPRQSSGVSESTLATNDVPAAALSAFIATAQSEPRSVQFSQFA